MANPDTITISGNVFNVYGPRADADVYFSGKLNSASWTGALTTDRDKALVSASRVLDLESWEGVPTDLVTPQALSWPRTGVSDKNDVPVGTTAFPRDLLYGYYELAQQLIVNPSLNESSDQGSNIKSVTADVVNVRFFRATTGTRLPTIVHSYISQFLDLDSVDGGGFASGTDQCSEFEEPAGQLSYPY